MYWISRNNTKTIFYTPRTQRKILFFERRKEGKIISLKRKSFKFILEHFKCHFFSIKISTLLDTVKYQTAAYVDILAFEKIWKDWYIGFFIYSYEYRPYQYIHHFKKEYGTLTYWDIFGFHWKYENDPICLECLSLNAQLHPRT